MTVRSVALAFLALAFALAGSRLAAGDASTPLVLEAMIPLKDVSGRIDHMAVALAPHGLAVAELGNDTVDVIDLGGNHAVHRIAGLKEPQGVVFAPAGYALVVANGEDGSVRFFRAGDLGPSGMIVLGD